MKLHHRLEGPCDAPVIVLSGSLGTTLELWDPQVEALAANFCVVRYDGRGHGRSPAPEGAYTIDDLVEDALELLDDLKLERVSFCGLSIGGAVGIALAARAPERIERLVVACAAPQLPPARQWWERAATVRAHGLEAIADAVVSRWVTASAPVELVERLRAMLVATPREGYAACCEALGEMELDDRLTAISAPTLVLTGADDPIVPPERGAALAAALRNARHETIDEAAHIACAERPEVFSSHLLAHLTEAQ